MPIKLLVIDEVDPTHYPLKNPTVLGTFLENPPNWTGQFYVVGATLNCLLIQMRPQAGCIESV